MPTFPDGFLWGAATSAQQIEGAPLADGAGPSIWHRFAHTPGRTASGATGDGACDHYHRYASDVDLMADLGLQAYRFSIAWSRLFPEGTGPLNPKGLAFYDRLVDALLENGIQPFATLYHWDLPAALDDRGGWLNRDVAHWFADYAQAAFQRLGDRVRHWTTLNEPWVVMDAGYLHGVHAPGHANLFEVPLVAHNLLRAHGAAVQAYRAAHDGQIGLVVNLEPKYPATDTEADRAAAARGEAYMNRYFLDPVFHGHYPELLPVCFGQAWPDFPEEDFAAIQSPIDFLGINYYTRGLTADDPQTRPLHYRTVPHPRHAYTEMDWEVFPQALYDVLSWVQDRYGNLPLYITENGASFYDPPQVEPGYQDPLRVDYYRAHLRACHRAIQDGVDLRGYFAWSFMDNFEWGLGYTRRFGIVHVDFETQQRTPKASARYYSDVIRTHGAALFEE